MAVTLKPYKVMVLMLNLLESRAMLDIYSGYGVKYTISPAPFL